MVRRASCGLQRQAGCRVCTQAHAPALAVSGEEAQHSSLLRARRAALVVVGLGSIEGRRVGGKPLSFGARPWCDVPAAASNAKPAAACERKRTRACARCLSGGGAALELAARARRAALVVVGLGSIRRTPHRREASLLRRAAVVRRASCSLQRQAGCRVCSASAQARSLSLGRRRSTRACCARAVLRWLWSA